jgi:hypothetical protein
MIAKTRGRDLPAGIAVNAGGVDIELAFCVLRQPLVDLGHEWLDSVGAQEVAFHQIPMARYRNTL